MRRSYERMIGKVFPFFIGNANSKSYYLYQVVSPKLNEKCRPLLTLQKISERVPEGEYSASAKYMNHGDIIATLLKSKKKLEVRAAKYLEKDILSRYFDEKDACPNVYKNGMDFPMFDYDFNIVKMIVVGLRDNLRWSRYRLQPDTEIDILISPTQYGVFEIQGDKDYIKLVFKTAYDNSDVERRHPIHIENPDVIQYPKVEFRGEKRASDLNKAIRQAELKAFEMEAF